MSKGQGHPAPGGKDVPDSPGSVCQGEQTSSCLWALQVYTGGGCWPTLFVLCTKAGQCLSGGGRCSGRSSRHGVRPGLGFQCHPQVHLPAATSKAAPTWRLAPGRPWMMLIRFPFSSGGEPCLGVASSFISTRPEFDLTLRLPPQRGWNISVYLMAHQATRPLLNSSVVPRRWGVRSPQISPHCFGEDSFTGPRVPPPLAAWRVTGDAPVAEHLSPHPRKKGWWQSPGEGGSREPILWQRGCLFPPNPRPGVQDSTLDLASTETWVWASASASLSVMWS